MIVFSRAVETLCNMLVLRLALFQHLSKKNVCTVSEPCARVATVDIPHVHYGLLVSAKEPALLWPLVEVYQF